MYPTLMSALMEDRMNSRHVSPELRAFLRDEFRGDGTWILAQLRRNRKPFRARLAARLFPSRERRPQPVETVPSPRSRVTAVPSAAPADEDACAHLVAEELGEGGASQYLRCVLCGGVIVAFGNRRVLLAP